MLMEKLMARSRVQAPYVARAVLAGVERNQLYIVPMIDGCNDAALQAARAQRFDQIVGSRVMKVSVGKPLPL